MDDLFIHAFGNGSHTRRSQKIHFFILYKEFIERYRINFFRVYARRKHVSINFYR